MNDPEDNDTDLRVAIAALAMDTESVAEGQRPDHDELWDFINGAVTGQRRDEILSHLADDEELFSQWHSLKVTIKEVSELGSEFTATEESAQVATTSTGESEHPTTADPEAKASWWHHLLNPILQHPLPSAALAATLVGILIIAPPNPLRQEPKDFWQEWSQPISAATAIADAATQADFDAVLVGARAQLIKLNYQPLSPARTPLPEQIPTCQSANTLCLARRDALSQLGALSIEQLHECFSQSTNSVSNQTDPAEVAKPVLDQGIPVPLIAPLNAWISAHEQDDRLLTCEALSNFLSPALYDE